MYYIQSSPILTRLQASVIYILARLFEKTSVYIIPSSSPSLLFIFQVFQKVHLHEYKEILIQPKLLQFVHIHQLLGKSKNTLLNKKSIVLLDEHFAFDLLQANNLCLQIEYILTT